MEIFQINIVSVPVGVEKCGETSLAVVKYRDFKLEARGQLGSFFQNFRKKLILSSFTLKWSQYTLLTFPTHLVKVGSFLVGFFNGKFQFSACAEVGTPAYGARALRPNTELPPQNLIAGDTGQLLCVWMLGSIFIRTRAGAETRRNTPSFSLEIGGSDPLLSQNPPTAYLWS